MNISIRNARKEDAQDAVPLIMEAIGDIAMHMTGETEEAKVTKEFEHLFTRTDNRHSYLYTYIAEMEGKLLVCSCFIRLSKQVHSMQIWKNYLSNKKGNSSQNRSRNITWGMVYRYSCSGPYLSWSRHWYKAIKLC